MHLTAGSGGAGTTNKQTNKKQKKQQTERLQSENKAEKGTEKKEKKKISYMAIMTRVKVKVNRPGTKLNMKQMVSDASLTDQM